MNTKQIQLALVLSETLNFSQAAQKLGMSQPALSKQILSLEKELGVKLFDRSSNPMTLTAAGESFVWQSRELLFRQEQLEQSMTAYQSGEAGRLVIGISPFRTLYLIPQIVKKIRQKFPGVQVFLHEAGSNTLRKEAAEGRYDFAIVNMPVDEAVLNVTPLEQDTLALAIPNSLLHLLPEAKEPLSQIDLQECQKLPFVTVGKNQEMRILFDKLCAQANFRPNIAMEVVGLTTAWAMTHAGIGATVLPLQFLSSETFDKDITLFIIKDNHYSRQPVIVTRQGQYISPYARYAIDLLTSNSKD